MRGRDLLSISDLTPSDLARLLDTAMALKDAGKRPILAGKTLALVFEKPSLRTRVSFDVAMPQLGGHCIYISPPEVGLGQRETAADVARVLSRYVDAIAARTFDQATVRELAEHADVPVINALSDEEHPCQALADLLTVREKRGGLRGVTVGVRRRRQQRGELAGSRRRHVGHEPACRLAEGLPATGRCPGPGAGARRAKAAAASARTTDPAEAVTGADVVYTDVWASMGQEDEASSRRGIVRRLHRSMRS